MIRIKEFRIRIMGSLVCMIALIMLVMPQAALAVSSHNEMNGLTEPVEINEIDAADGIVRIQTGFNNNDGVFNAERTFSGFVVSDAGSGGVYILTTWHNVNLGQNTVVHVIVKNDTAVEAGIESYSEEQDFCILSADSMNRKKALPLRVVGYDEENDKISDGAAVSALGFKRKTPAGTEFSSSDVSINEGKILSMSFEKDGATYISHTAGISGGLDGGPLVDENGYVIGINNPEASEDENCALLIQEADKLLDSSGIIHRTKDKDLLYSNLYSLCDKSIDTYSKIKKEYKSDLYDSIQNAIKVMSESPYNRSALADAESALQTALDKAEYKTPVLLYIIIALGLVIAAMTARLITLIMWNRRYEADNPGAKPVKVRDDQKLPQTKASEVKEQTVCRVVIRRTGAEYELRKNIVTIGRDRGADICIEDNKYIARMHAMIEKRKTAYFLHDMGSTNGTFLNGQPVTDSGIRLISGDTIVVANEEMDFI